MTGNIIFLHGQESSSQTYKAGVMRGFFPDLIVPDFTGPLEQRMEALYPILVTERNGSLSGPPLED